MNQERPVICSICNQRQEKDKDNMIVIPIFQGLGLLICPRCKVDIEERKPTATINYFHALCNVFITGFQMMDKPRIIQ